MEWIDKAIEQYPRYDVGTTNGGRIRGLPAMLAKMQTFLIREGHRPWDGK